MALGIDWDRAKNWLVGTGVAGGFVTLCRRYLTYRRLRARDVAEQMQSFLESLQKRVESLETQRDALSVLVSAQAQQIAAQAEQIAAAMHRQDMQKAEIIELRAENTRLRAMLAQAGILDDRRKDHGSAADTAE